MSKRSSKTTATDSIFGNPIQESIRPAGDLVLQESFPEIYRENTGKPQPITRYHSPHIGRSEIIDRAVRYLAKMPPAVEGERGHDACYHAACVLRVDFDLTVEESLDAIHDWNAACKPPWEEHELRHKLDDAGKAAGERGRLLRQDSDRYQAAYPLTVASNAAERQRTVEPPHWSTFFDAVPADKFDAMEFPLTWLVEGVLVQGDPVIWGGPRKALKTTLLAELGIALASGTPFLDKYAVPEKRNVWMLTVESGGRTVQETFRRIADSRGVAFRDLKNTFLTDVYKVPELRNVLYVDAMIQFVKDNEISVVIVDPSYLAIPLAADEQANISAVGRILQHSLTRIRNETDGACTPILAAHFKKNMPAGQVPDMSDISGAGFDAWGRQFGLVNRLTPHDADNPGHHDLILKWGGSSGHQGQTAVIVDEGTIEAGRTWDVGLLSLEQFKQGRRNDQQNGKDDERHNKNRPRIFEAIRSLEEQGKAATQSAIKKEITEPTIQLEQLKTDLQRMLSCDDLRRGTENRNSVFHIVTAEMRLDDSERENLDNVLL